MFQSLLENIIKEYIGEYVEDLDQNNLRMSVFNGLIDLTNLKLKKDLFRRFNVPIDLVAGRIKKLCVRVPWNALSSKPVQLEIEGLQMLLVILDKSHWEEFFEGASKFDALHEAIVKHAMATFNSLRAKNGAVSDDAQASQGYLSNLTLKIFDNIQVRISNIHIRFEEAQILQTPFSQGITLERLDIQTTNEDWQVVFIDRTIQENKALPLQKVINLQNLGIYCNPNDLETHMLSSGTRSNDEEIKEGEEAKTAAKDEDALFSLFDRMFPVNYPQSEIYKENYLSQPVSIVTKLKHLNPLACSLDTTEALYQINCQIEKIKLQLYKSQFEQLFHFLEMLNDYQKFVDSSLNQRAFNLQTFFKKKAGGAEQCRQKFEQRLLSVLRKEINPKRGTINLDDDDIWQNIILNENALKLNKWIASIVESHYRELEDLVDHDREEEKKKAEEAAAQAHQGYASQVWAMTGGWLGQRAGAYLTSTDEQEQQLHHQQQTRAVEHRRSNSRSSSRGGSDIDEDEFQDAVDQPAESAFGRSSSLRPSEAVPLARDSSERPSSIDELFARSDFFADLQDQNDVLERFRASQQQQAQADEDDAVTLPPIFSGQFVLRAFEVNLINDELVKAEQNDEQHMSHMYDSNSSEQNFSQGEDSQESGRSAIDQTGLQEKQSAFTELVMYSRNFVIKYDHFDAKDLSNLNQVEIGAKCDDVGVLMRSEDRQQLIMHKSKLVAGGGALLDISVHFGNQNIKEAMIARLDYQRTADFVDQAVTLRFRPVTLIYSLEFMAFLSQFCQIKSGIDDEVRLRALEEYEKIRMSVMQMQKQNEKQVEGGGAATNLELRVELDSSQIQLPIKPVGQMKNQANRPRECWVFNTGNAVITNSKVHFAQKSSRMRPEQGYTPLNIEITAMNMLLQSGDSQETLLKDFDVGVLLMFLDKSKKKATPRSSGNLALTKGNQADMKLRVMAGSLRIVFSPISYVHLVNMSACFVQDEDPAASCGRCDDKIVERYEIFRGAIISDQVRMKLTDAGDFVNKIGILSGSYIYMFDVKYAQDIEDLIEASRDAQPLNKRRKTQLLSHSAIIAAKLQNIAYDDYFLVKGCDRGQLLPAPSEGAKETLRLQNSLGFKLQLQFEEKQQIEEWRDAVQERARHIDAVLGKTHQRHEIASSVGFERQISQEVEEGLVEAAREQELTRPLQEIDVSLNQIELIIEGASKLRLDSCSVEPDVQDVVILSVEELAQFTASDRQATGLGLASQPSLRRRPSTAAVISNASNFKKQWSYAILFQQFQLKISQRMYDNTMKIYLQSVLIKEVDLDGNRDMYKPGEEPREYPVLLQTFHQADCKFTSGFVSTVGKKEARGSRSQAHPCVSITINTQSAESPRYENVQRVTAIEIGRLHFNWNAVSMNRVIRFFMYMQYVQQLVAAKKRAFDESFKIRMQNIMKQSTLSRRRFDSHQSNEAPSAAQLNQANTLKLNDNPPIIRCDSSEDEEIQIDKEALAYSSQPGMLKQTSLGVPTPQQIAMLSPRRKMTLGGLRKKSRAVSKRHGSFGRGLLGFAKELRRTTCAEDTTVQQQISCKIEKISLACIHPQNKTLPIFTMKITELLVQYAVLCDHSTISGSMGNFRIMDNTRYPRTCDPFKRYQQSEKVHSHQILGFQVNENGAGQNEHALTFDVQMFTHPNDKSCPIQSRSPKFDRLVKLKMRQLRLNYVQELMFRLNDYFFYQILYAATDTDPYADIVKRLAEDIDPLSNGAAIGSSRLRKKKRKNPAGSDSSDSNESELSRSKSPDVNEANFIIPDEDDAEGQPQSSCSSEKSEVPVPDRDGSSSSDEDAMDTSKINYEDFDLKQYTMTSGLDINIENPVIVLRDRPYFSDKSIEIDLGYIQITSRLEERLGRWAEFPSKPVLVNVMDIDMQQVRIDYHQQKQSSFQITPPFDMNIAYERLNYSSLLLDDFLSKGIDFTKFDKSDHISIKSATPFQLNLQSEMYSYFLRLLDLNVNYMDEFTAGYQLFTWNSQDFMKYLDREKAMVSLFKDRSVQKRGIDILFSSFSIRILDDAYEMVSELVLPSFSIQLKQYVDYKKQVQMTADTFFILCQDAACRRGSQVKNLIIGPVLSKKQLTASDLRKYSGEEVSEEPHGKDFRVKVDMGADGAKTIHLELTGLKLFLKVDVLQIVSTFFTGNFPDYSNAAVVDRPSYFDPDTGNLARFEMVVTLSDCLICFEQVDLCGSVDADHGKKIFNKTIAFQGQLEYHYVKEKVNEVKRRLLKTPTRDMMQAVQQSMMPTSSLLKHQAKLTGQQIHLIDFQPFFCDVDDLCRGGIRLKHIYKRQMISPFNLFFNQSGLIEMDQRHLTQARRREVLMMDPNDDALSGALLADKYFKFYKKQELNLDLAEIYVSFNDIVALKGIGMRMDEMNRNFAEYYENFQQRKASLQANATSVSKQKQQNSGSKKTAPNATQPPGALASKHGQNISGVTRTQQLPNNAVVLASQGAGGGRMSRQAADVDSDECEADIDFDEEQEAAALFRKNVADKTAKMVTMKRHKPADKVEEEQQQGGIDQMQIVSHGLKFLLINDKDNNFLPVLSVNFSGFTVNWDKNAKESLVWADLRSSVNFFNVNVGVWEPFLEPFSFMIMSKADEVTANANYELDFYSPLNVNFTEKLIMNIYESGNSWREVNEMFEQVTGALKSAHDHLRSQGQMYSSPSPKRAAMSQLQLQRVHMTELDALMSDDEIFGRNVSKTEEKHGGASHDSPTKSDPNCNEEIITPYVIVNKTDVAIVIKRLVDRDRPSTTAAHLLEERERGFSAKDYGTQGTIDRYRLASGQIIDYMVDYQSNKFKFSSTRGSNVDADDLDQQSNGEMREAAVHPGDAIGAASGSIHKDSIGEYKSEFIKVVFDEASIEVAENYEEFRVNKEIKKIDLNRLGLKSHVLREGQFLEQVYYGVRLQDFKKVLTVRTQFLLVNKTAHDYLVHFRLAQVSLVKLLESGDSLPLANRLDKSKIQIKILKAKNNEDDKSEQSQGRVQQSQFKEMQLAADQRLIDDFKNPRHSCSEDWSALIPLSVMKYRLKFNEGSFLTNSTSRFTFIRKVRSDPERRRNIVDINLETPMIIKNCLPLDIAIEYVDSSGVPGQQSWKTKEERSLYCFSLAESVSVTLYVQGFMPKTNYKLFNLQNYKKLESRIELANQYGQRTLIYAKVSHKDSGHRVVFYAKKLLTDQIQSNLCYSYVPEVLPLRSDGTHNLMHVNQIPYVELPAIQQKLYMIPEGFTDVYVSVPDCIDDDVQKIEVETPGTQVEFTLATADHTLNYCYSTNLYLASEDEYVYSKITTVNPYFILINQSRYSILVDQAASAPAQFEHASSEAAGGLFSDPGTDPSPETFDRIPYILEPGQRSAFFYRCINRNIPGIDEFVQVRILDEEITHEDLVAHLHEQRRQRRALAANPESVSSSMIASSSPLKQPKQSLSKGTRSGSQASANGSSDDSSRMGSGLSSFLRAGAAQPGGRSISFHKNYSWSSPFMISEVDQFTLKIAPDLARTRLQEQMNAANLAVAERGQLMQMMSEPKYLRVYCKANLKQAVGSMLIIFEEEAADACQYIVVNKSASVELTYCQHIVNNPVWSKRININEATVQRCRPCQQQRFSWDSVLHQKILRLSFSKRSTQQSSSKLEITQVQKTQEGRVIPNPNGKATDILIPFDKIGHEEDIALVQRMDLRHLVDTKSNAYAFTHKVRLEIVTNGSTKFLQLSDVTENEQLAARGRQTPLVSKNLESPGPEPIETNTQLVKVSLQRLLISFIHKKCELMTVFLHRLQLNSTDTPKQRIVKFSLGYMQIDNQSESDPSYPVLLKPRDLFFDEEKEQIMLLADGGMVASEDAKLFQFTMTIKKDILVVNALEKEIASDATAQVVYIDNIMFLLQTLDIKVQFSHFLRLTNYAQSLGRIVNKSVNQVHYLFAATQQMGSLTHGSVEDELNWSRQEQSAASTRKQDRLKKYAKVVFAVPNAESSHGSAKKVEATIMDIAENNWRFDAASLAHKSNLRLFIREYQSSPTELYVSAINERLSSSNEKETKSTIDQTEETEADVTRKNDEDDDEPASDDTQSEQEGAIKLLGALGEGVARRMLYFSTFEDMHFQVNCVNINHIFGEANDVVGLLAQYHQEQLKFNAFVLLGSSNLIGNPTRLVSTIGTGFSDFFYKPYQGVREGSMHKVTDGLVEGSKSLLTNSLMAPVGAVAKMGSSLSKGMLAFSFDDEFTQQKQLEDKRNQSKSFGDGVKKGFASASSSIYSGVAGVFTQPAEGARSEGLFGLLKGGAKGVSGLFAKTISGGLDVIAKSSEGLSNQMNGARNDFQQARIRRPRPFYETYSIIKPYSDAHAFWISMLKQRNSSEQQQGISQVFEVFQVNEANVTKNLRRNSDEESQDIVLEQEQRCSVFVLTQHRLYHITSTTHLQKSADYSSQSPQGAASASISKFDKKKTEHRLEKSHHRRDILFVEAIGYDRSIVLIGFADIENNEHFMRRIADQKAAAVERVGGRNSMTSQHQQNTRFVQPYRGTPQKQPSVVGATSLGLAAGRPSATSVRSRGPMPGFERPAVDGDLDAGSGRSQAQIGLIRQALTEQVLWQKQQHGKSVPHVQMGHGWLQIEFPSIDRARQFINVIRRVSQL